MPLGAKRLRERGTKKNFFFRHEHPVIERGWRERGGELTLTLLGREGAFMLFSCREEKRSLFARLHGH